MSVSTISKCCRQKIPRSYQHSILTLCRRQISTVQKLRRVRMNVELDADERLFSVCANGKLGDLKNLISYTSTLKLDSSNSRGWTALMFAARNGHVDITKTLVKEGVKLDAMNNLGQTAYDIASFWNHKEVMSLLSLPDDNLPQEPVHFFTVKNLDRASEKRKDSDWLKQNLASSPNSRILVFVKTFPVIEAEGKLVDLKLFKYNEVDSYIDVEDLDKSEVVLLGVDHEKDLTYFAINIDKDKGKELIKSSTDNLYVLERIRDAFILSTEQAALAGLAHSMFDWHNRCRYCQTCGSVTRFSEGGYKRTCTNQTCLTVREIKNSSYPRLDPTIIASVVSPDKSKLLLARGLRFPTPNMWSCLAGFMEPGESMEDACRREVFEEAGVTLGKVTYHSSQPWPFPTQLMIGLTGQATSETITVDTSELADARWFSRAEVVSMMMRKHPDGLVIPPHQAIAHHLIKSFLHQSTSTNSKL